MVAERYNKPLHQMEALHLALATSWMRRSCSHFPLTLEVVFANIDHLLGLTDVQINKQMERISQ